MWLLPEFSSTPQNTWNMEDMEETKHLRGYGGISVTVFGSPSFTTRAAPVRTPALAGLPLGEVSLKPEPPGSQVPAKVCLASPAGARRAWRVFILDPLLSECEVAFSPSTCQGAI
jgi:hypothetical protein